MNVSPKSGWRNKLQRILKWVGVTLLGLVLLAGLLLCLALSFPARLLPLANSEFEKALPGALSIDRVSTITWNGATGVDLTLRNPEGEVMARAFDVSVRTSWRQLVSELLSNNPTLNIAADSITLQTLHVDLGTTTDGELRLMRALVASDTGENPSSTSVALEFKKIRIVHAWVYGDIGGTPLDAQLTELATTLSLDEASLEVQGLTTSAQIRAPALYSPSIQLSGHCGIRFSGDDLSLKGEATLISQGATIESLFSLHEEQIIKIQASGTLPPALATRLVPHASQTTEFIASAQGTPADFTTQLMLKNGSSQIEIDANIQTSDGLRLDGRVQLKEINGSLFDLPDLTDLDAELRLSAERSDTLTPELDRWKANVEGSVRHVKIKEKDLPPLSLKAQYDRRILRVWVEEKVNSPSSRVEATALLSPAGLQTINAKGSVRARLLSATLTDVDSKGVVLFDAELANEMTTIKADLSGNLWDFRGTEAFKADRLTFAGSVSGRLSNPKVHLKVQAPQVYLDGREFKDADVELRGTLASSRVQVHGIIADRKLEAAATLGFSSDGLRVADGRVSLSDDESKSSVSVESVRAIGDQVVFSHLRLEGLGTSDLSGHWSPKSVKLQGHIRNAPLQKIAGLASVKLPLSGVVDLDADISVDRGTSAGRLLLEVADLKFDDGVLRRDLPKTEFKLEIVGEGRHLSGDLDATLPDPKRPEQPGEIKLHARLDTPRAWNRLPPGPLQEQFVSIQGRIALEAQQVSQFTDLRGEIEGRVVAEFEATRQQGYQIPQLNAQIETSQLALTILVADNSGDDGNVSPTRIEGYDFKVTAHHDPLVGNSETRLEILESGEQIGLLEAALEAPLTPLFEGRQDTLASAPLSLRLALPSFQLEKLPQPIRPDGVVGTVGLTLEVNGSMRRPTFKTEVTFENLGPDSVLEGRALRLSGRAHGEYDAKTLKWNASGRSPRGANVESTGELEAPWDASTLSPKPRVLSTDLSIRSLPLESFQSLAQQQVRGTVDMTLLVKDWGTTQERVNAEVKLVDLDVPGVERAQGRFGALLEENQIQGSLLLSGKSYSVAGVGEVSILREGMWGVELGDKQGGSLKAKDLPLGIVQSIVGSQVAGISGKANLNLRAESEANRVEIAADFKLKNGALQLPSLGQQFRDIGLEGTWRNGKIVVERASFSGISGRATLKAEAEMENFKPLRAAVHLKVERKSRLPVSLLGMGMGEIWGDLKTDCDFDHENRHITISTKINKFHLWFPELPTHSVQALAPAERIKVGVVVGTDEFVQVALQPVTKQDKTQDPWTVRAKFDLGDEFWLQQGPSRRIQLTGRAQLEVADEVRVRGNLGLARGTFELNGRAFEVHRGTITFQPDEPDNPLIVLDARWYSPEGITVIAAFSGPAKTGTLSLTSDPPLRDDQVVSLLLFGDTSGLGEGAASGGSDSANQAATVGGSLASSGLNQALGRIKGVDLTTRVRGEDGNVRPEVVVQLTNSLSAQLGYNLEEPSPGKSPDRTLLTFEARLVGGSAVSATIGDQGSSLVNWVWRYRY